MNEPTAPTTTAALPSGGGFARVVLLATTATIAVLTFAFSFRNVWVLGDRLAIDAWISPLVGPAVDLSVVGLLITVQWLALAGVPADQLRPARRLLKWCGVITMLLNSAPSLIVGVTTGNAAAYGRAAVEAIAPWLLIAWSHVGPIMLRLFVETVRRHATAPVMEHVTVAGAEVVTGPVSEPVTEHVTEVVSEPLTRPVTTPTTEAPADPSPDPSRRPPPTALKVAKLRAAKPAITQREAAAKLGVSVTTVGRHWQAATPDTKPPVNGHAKPELLPAGSTT